LQETSISIDPVLVVDVEQSTAGAPDRLFSRPGRPHRETCLFAKIRPALVAGIDILELEAALFEEVRYDREAIERAIRDETAKGRPRELRDWTEYAKRTVDRAFGLPGRRELDALARTRDRLFELEGRRPSMERALDWARRRGPEIER
jgi:hypothetical protein